MAKGVKRTPTGFHGHTVLPDLSTKKLFNALHPQSVRTSLPLHRNLAGSIHTTVIGSGNGGRTKTGRVRRNRSR